MVKLVLVISVCLCFLAKEGLSNDIYEDNGIETEPTNISSEYWNKNRTGKIFIQPLLEVVKAKLDFLNKKIGWKFNTTTSSSTTITTPTTPTTTRSTTKPPMRILQEFKM